MSHTRHGNAPLMTMIMLTIATIAFAFFAYQQSDKGRIIHEGDNTAKIKPKDSLRGIENEITEIQQTIETQQEQKERLLQKRHELGMTLASLGAYARDGEIYAQPNHFNYMQSSLGYIQHINELLAHWDQAYKADGMQEFTHLDDLIAKQKRAIDDTTRRIDEADDRFNDLKDRLNAEIDRLTDEKRLIEEEARYNFSVLATRKSQMEAQIRKLLELELKWLQELEPDGSVLEVDLDRRFLVIDLGRRDDIDLGMRFEVFSRIKGQYAAKGMIEVVDMEKEIATARIIAEKAPFEQPIVPGDSIGNPIYDHTRPQSFVLAGEFQEYNRSDLARFLRRSGAKVLDKVGPGIDFLVAGDRSESEQDAARQYHVMAMYEDTLLRFLNTTFGREDQP